MKISKAQLRGVFVRYMQAVIQTEGVPFIEINDASFRFTDAEKKVLMSIKVSALRDQSTKESMLDGAE